MIGIEDMIKKAVQFSFDRHPNIKSDGIYNIQLDGMTKIEDVIAQIARSFKLTNPNPTEQSLIEAISKLKSFSLIGFSRCSFLEDTQNQVKLLDLLQRIIDV